MARANLAHERSPASGILARKATVYAMHVYPHMRDLLGGEDASWLHMEDPTNPMVINSLIEMGGVLDLETVHRVLAVHALPPRFRSRIVERHSGVGVPGFDLDPNFRSEDHVFGVRLEKGERALRSFVSAEVGRLLDRERPLWRLYVIDREDSPTVLFFRVHHALADGFALLDLLTSLCDEHSSSPTAPTTHGSSAGGALRQGASLARLVTLPADPTTSLKNPLGREKRVAWSAPISLERVKAIGRGASATVNDVLVSAVCGAIGRELDARSEHVSDLHAMVPVNLRSHSSAALGNQFGLVILAMPVGISDPKQRLREVKRRMDHLKATPEAVVALDILRVMGHVPRMLEDAGVAFFGKKTSLVLTNVPGPRTILHLGGVPIARLIFWVPQAARMGLGISIFSYANEVTVGVFADKHVLEHPDLLVKGLEEDLTALEHCLPE